MLTMTLSAAVFIVFLIHLISPSSAQTCDTAKQCVGKSMSPNRTAFKINGYKAAIGPTTSFSGQAGKTLLCDGSYSCQSISSITASGSVYCKGTHSCFNTSIHISTENTISLIACKGVESCAFSNLTITDYTVNITSNINCHGEKSCANSRVSPMHIAKGTGRQAFYFATIESQNDLIIDLRGDLTGYGATLICHIGHICTIHCRGRNSCYMFYIHCLGTDNCNVLVNNTNIIPPITNTTQLNIDIDGDIYNDMHMTNTDHICNTHPNAITYDSLEQKTYSDIIIASDSENSGPICCRGSNSCYESNITYMSMGIAGAPVVCSGEKACKRGIMNTNNRSIFCESNEGCRNSQIENAFYAHCMGYASCRKAIIVSSRYIMCSTKLSCADADIRSAGNDLDIYFTGEKSGWISTIHCDVTDSCNIMCIGYVSCLDTTLICNGVCNVYCDLSTKCPLRRTSTPTPAPTYAPTYAPTDDPTPAPTTGYQIELRGTCDNYMTAWLSKDGTEGNYIELTQSQWNGDLNDWTSPKVLTTEIPNLSAKIKIQCTNAPTDCVEGPGGLLFSVRFLGEWYSTNGGNDNNGYYSLIDSASGISTVTDPGAIWFSLGLDIGVPTPHGFTWTCSESNNWACGGICGEYNTYVFDFAYFLSPDPTIDPTTDPTYVPTLGPTDPTVSPTNDPTVSPSNDPSNVPTMDPSQDPTVSPTADPTMDPTSGPITDDPTTKPITDPTMTPAMDPSLNPIWTTTYHDDEDIVKDSGDSIYTDTGSLSEALNYVIVAMGVIIVGMIAICLHLVCTYQKKKNAINALIAMKLRSDVNETDNDDVMGIAQVAPLGVALSGANNNQMNNLPPNVMMQSMQPYVNQNNLLGSMAAHSSFNQSVPQPSQPSVQLVGVGLSDRGHRGGREVYDDEELIVGDLVTNGGTMYNDDDGIEAAANIGPSSFVL